MEFLPEETVRSLLTYEDLIPAVERALVDLSAGKIQQPVRGILWVPQHNGVFAQMPAVDGELMGVKLVTFYESNRTLPTHQATIQLFSATTGEPLVAMDGRLITEMRTAAVSAVATRCLARDDARALAILGSGVQARSHLEALRRVRSFQQIRVWSRSPENARRFADEFRLATMPSAEAAVRGADVVVSVTATHDPLVRGAWLADQALVCAVGAVGPHKRELDDAALAADIVVESREAAGKESGDLIGAGATVTAELGEVLAGAALPGRGRWTIFKSLGVAAEDLAAAKIVWYRWRKKWDG
ncbi:MAG TPA: ornithine cyclodeaminase family protein [Acidobacteriaceae bacterium]|nr:ornithine cyclodeaminase family protein [Acidobacteriaceae bacterium]